MNRKSLVFVTLLLSCGVAAAKDQNIASVEVRPESQPRVDFACANPTRLAAADVEQLLGVNDRRQTPELSDRLMGAVAEACNAGVPSIVVQRAASGHSVTWRAARSYEANIALR